MVEEDTVNESDFSDADTLKFSVRPMRPVKSGTRLRKTWIHSIIQLIEGPVTIKNTFQVLSDKDIHDETTNCLDS